MVLAFCRASSVEKGLVRRQSFSVALCLSIKTLVSQRQRWRAKGGGGESKHVYDSVG